MNDTIFMFAVIPATICFITTLFALIFGPEVLHWYNAKKAAQQRQLARTAPVQTVATVERYEREETYEPATRTSDRRELVTH